MLVELIINKQIYLIDTNHLQNLVSIISGANITFNLSEVYSDDEQI